MATAEDMRSHSPLPGLPSPIQEEYIDCTSSCGLNFHILKAGNPSDPLILFCHGYPELAYSWRNVLPAIAEKGYFCVAPDQRGYGRTTGRSNAAYEDVNLNEYVSSNLVRDLVCLVYAMGYGEKRVECIVGHDFGAVISGMAALIRPDFFRSTVQLSHPYKPPASPPSPSSGAEGKKKEPGDIQADLAALDPPRKPYKWYNSSSQAASDWDNPQQGLESFLRGYFHLKSADWAKNTPHPLREWSATELEKMPEYYVMRLGDSMPQTVARNMASEDGTKTESWLSPETLAVYCSEWKRTGFQGALNWYRAFTASNAAIDGYLFAGKKLGVPCKFISGAQDWGNHQQPGALGSYYDERIVVNGASRGIALIEGAGHWVQQEKSDQVIKELLAFLDSLKEGSNYMANEESCSVTTSR